jgi:hypothetical protein
MLLFGCHGPGCLSFILGTQRYTLQHQHLHLSQVQENPIGFSFAVTCDGNVSATQWNWQRNYVISPPRSDSVSVSAMMTKMLLKMMTMMLYGRVVCLFFLVDNMTPSFM